MFCNNNNFSYLCSINQKAGVMRYVAYYRTSTTRQNLGIEAQQASVHQFLEHENGAELLAEFSEQESGKDNNRPQLETALRLCKQENAVLLIAKLDRLSRRVSFIFALREASVRFKALDMPEVNDVLTLSIYAGLAEQERTLISKRTKAALAALKAKGVKLGTNNLTDEGRAKGAAAMKKLAEDNVNNIKAAAQAKKLQASGHSLNKIAKILNEQGITTARGRKHSATSVMRLLYRF